MLAGLRDFAQRSVEELGAEVDRDVLAVVVAELTANAAVHQEADAELVLERLDDGSLRISVTDPDPSMPQMGDQAPWDTDGHRGLQLIAALTSDWGVDPVGPGKAVWAVLPALDAVATQVRRSG